MTYDGTVAIADPSVVESYDIDDRTRCYVLRDDDAPAPDWDGIGYVFSIGHDGRDDSTMVPGDGSDSDPMPHEVIRAAWDRFRDSGMVARYLRAFHGAVSVDYSDSNYRDAKVWGVVTAEQADAWGITGETRRDSARMALELVGAWAEGSVYVVRVVDTETGAETSVSDVYDSSGDLSYCRSVAAELVTELREDSSR